MPVKFSVELYYSFGLADVFIRQARMPCPTKRKRLSVTFLGCLYPTGKNACQTLKWFISRREIFPDNPARGLVARRRVNPSFL